MLCRLVAFRFQLSADAFTELTYGFNVDVSVNAADFYAVLTDACPFGKTAAGASAAKFESFQIFILLPCLAMT